MGSKQYSCTISNNNSKEIVFHVTFTCLFCYFFPQYVIKKLSLRNAPRKERKAAEQEAQLLSKLKHPNIVAYKESWEGEDGLLYIVMGFCEGGDLYRTLKDQKGKLLPESKVVEWFVQITMALQVRSFLIIKCL